MPYREVGGNESGETIGNVYDRHVHLFGFYYIEYGVNIVKQRDENKKNIDCPIPNTMITLVRQ